MRVISVALLLPLVVADWSGPLAEPAANVLVDDANHTALYGAHNPADYDNGGLVGRGPGRTAVAPNADRAGVTDSIAYEKAYHNVVKGAGVMYEKTSEALDHKVWAQDLSFLTAANCGAGSAVEFSQSEPICEDSHRLDHGHRDQAGNMAGNRTCKVLRLFADKPSWPANGFCSTAPKTVANMEVGAEDAALGNDYIIRSDMLNWFGHYSSGLSGDNENWYDGEDIGHVGIYYNAQNANNYDFVYIQPKDAVHCVQPGYVQGGVVKYYSSDPDTTAMRCSLKPKQMARKWFGVKVEMVDGVAIVTMEDEFGRLEEVAHIKPHFPQTARGGVLVANGFTNTAFFRNFYIRHVRHGRHAWDLVTDSCLPDSRVQFYTDQNLCPTMRPHPSCSVLKLHAKADAWPASGFCSTLPEDAVPFSGPYMLRANMYAAGGTSLGLMYNAHGMLNYDFLFVNIGNGAACVTSGYVDAGTVKAYGGGDGSSLVSTACATPPQPYTWFELTLRVHGTIQEPTMKAYLDGTLIATVNPHFQMRTSGGALVRNGNGHSAFSKNFEMVRDMTGARYHQKQCSHVQCHDHVDSSGISHVRVTHSNHEYMGDMHRCVLTSKGQGSMGNGLGKVGTWRATEDNSRVCECFCGDVLSQGVGELTGMAALTTEQQQFLEATRQKYESDQLAAAARAAASATP